MKIRRNQKEFAAKLENLQLLIDKHKEKDIDLRFADEAGFSLVPVSAAGWQHKDEQVRIFPQRDKRFNIFGLMNLNNQVQAYWTKQTITSQWIADRIDEFVATVKKPTVIVLDNAPVHKSKLMKAKIEQWEKNDVYIFFLPAYSPHLNAIEIFWKQIKYFWLRPENYLNLDALWKATFNIIKNFDQEFCLDLTNFLKNLKSVH